MTFIVVLRKFRKTPSICRKLTFRRVFFLYHSVKLKSQITHPQPMTGLVLWPEQAKKRHTTYGKSIQLEFSYCLPCKVVKGCAEDGTIEYDWSSFDALKNWMLEIGLPLTISEIGATPDMIPGITEGTICYPAGYMDLKPEDITEILKDSL